MKFLTDENIGLEVTEFLRHLSHNIKSVIQVSPGLSDVKVLQLAYKEKRILITSDTDFGELIYHRKQPYTGVILLRLEDETNINKIRILKSLLTSYSTQLTHRFVVVTESKVRIRNPLTKTN